ncbi:MULTISPECIES: GNAT family protein [Micrococcaceae]|uniref:GNAT family N-acetyltransferase n=1 Tax=Micrococcaceae TaxID=1268 RepID=UPI0010360142|nr:MULTISPECIES: GNAT family protein [Micrococcaceae]TAP28046.1 N-acetyltransferase [Arthrobacter sp. S41]UXN33157.1 GNAT family N-acetyltransferase [Glutamicibacter sp. M10]
MATFASETNTYAQTPTMEYAGVRLEQLSVDHADDLAEVVTAGALDKIWYTSIPSAQQMVDDIKNRLALQDAGVMAPFAIIDVATGKAVGATTYLNIDQPNRRVEIGATYLSVAAQGSGINPAAKYLLLQRAFEELDCYSVAFCTHWHNAASRAAITRLGAKQDGVLRNHKYDPTTGTLRDTVIFSILPHEWPAVRTNLQARLERHGRL